MQSPRAMQFLIGTDRIGYNERRNFAYLKTHQFAFTEVPDLIEGIRKIWHRVSGKSYSRLLHSCALPVDSSAIGFHYFNKILLKRGRWIVTFETTLPRFHELPSPLLKSALARLALPNCCAILGLSKSAVERFSQDLSNNKAGVGSCMRDKIEAKLKTLHPPQTTICSLPEKTTFCNCEGPLRLALIGNDFFRKGGLELLIVVDQLIAKGCQIELAIVGKMRTGDYASCSGTSDLAKARAIMDKHYRRISALGEVSNDRVVNLLKQTHIVCLPTWGDTYGYSVLEGQAAGCPAITTDLRAIPEINNENCGWVIPVPKLHNGDADIDTAAKRQEFRRILIEGLKISLSEACSRRNLVLRKAENALERIQTMHAPTAHQATLEAIYTRAFINAR